MSNIGDNVLGRKKYMKKLMVLFLAAFLAGGCSNNVKNNVIGPSLAPDAGAIAESSAQEAIVGSSAGSSSGAMFGAPEYSGVPSAAPSEAGAQSVSKVIFPVSLYETKDSEGYYAINTSNRSYFPGLWWATSMALKVKATANDGSDAIESYLGMGAGTSATLISHWVTIVVQKGPVTLKTSLTASNAFRSVTVNFTKKIQWDGAVSIIVKDAGDMVLDTTVTRTRSGWTGNFNITNTDTYTIPFWVHGETITYTGSFGHSAVFNLIRNNTWGNANYGYHTGSGAISYNGAEVALVHFSGDGNAYYTLTRESHSIQYPFKERTVQ
jgi:hypothetical protein